MKPFRRHKFLKRGQVTAVLRRRGDKLVLLDVSDDGYAYSPFHDWSSAMEFLREQGWVRV